MSLTDLKSQIEQKIDELRDQLYDTAMADLSLSNDESDILSSAIYQLKDIQQYLRFAFEDEIVTDEEKKELETQTRKVIDICTIMAESDKIITLEENTLLNIIRLTTKELDDIIAQIRTG